MAGRKDNIKMDIMETKGSSSVWQVEKIILKWILWRLKAVVQYGR
jgi:hypothetical protein